MSVPLQRLDRMATQQDQAAPFQYQALESQHTFRLLRLHAGQGDRITCSLHHYGLGSATCPSYRAISYTWGKDPARYNIYLAGNTVIKVRGNLRNALHSIRDNDSDCWLWIDAVCINQHSDTERNHQVRLMANIYGNANVVLVWVQSTGENADVARAFKFVHAAVTHNNSGHSVYRYIKAKSSVKDYDWRSLRNLCRLRYWTRKWIIQELIMARSVVLQAGNSKFSMTDLETFCRQLHQIKNNNTDRELFNTWTKIWDDIVSGPAGRLALQRSEANDRQQPRLLYELIERYSDSECQLPCDHVYALYSLVGDHRGQLDIDYAASPVQRLVAVLSFVHTQERIPPSKVLEFANLVIKLFELSQGELLRERNLLENLNLVVPATILGTVVLQPESKASIALRKVVNPLNPMPAFSLNTSQNIWVLTASEDQGGAVERVGRQDMTFFSISNSGFYGLAACRVQQGDVIWHFPETQLVFAVRVLPNSRALILGRAYLFCPARERDTLQFWLQRPFDYNAVRQGERHVRMDAAMLLDLGSFAVSLKDGTTDLKMDEKTSLTVENLKTVKRRLPRIVITAGSCKSSIFVK